MNKELQAIFEYMEREKGIKRDVVTAAIVESLHVAAKKSLNGASNIIVNIDPKTGAIEVFCEKQIVEKVSNGTLEIDLESAKAIDPDCTYGQFIDVEVTPDNFGRIAAQKARQVITQRLRGAEREVVYEEYRHRVGEIISGTVKRFVRGSNIVVDLGKVEGFMPMKEYPKTERYEVGDKIRALLLNVEDTENGSAQVILSRSDPQFVKQLFALEVPEISDGTVVIDPIVREAGYRTKLAVRSTDQRVDPVGACVGMRGSRVKNIVRELNNEKVDIIPFAQDVEELLQNALDPIQIRKISIDHDERTVFVVVDDADFANVIGRRGQNARLISDLIDYEFEVQKMSDYQKTRELERRELADLEDSWLDEPLKIKDINSMICDNLIAEGYTTARKLLFAQPQDLAKVPGLSLDLAEQILDAVCKQKV